jgi:hypothetical protein
MFVVSFQQNSKGRPAVDPRMILWIVVELHVLIGFVTGLTNDGQCAPPSSLAAFFTKDSPVGVCLQ